jgi:hypothetical protein
MKLKLSILAAALAAIAGAQSLHFQYVSDTITGKGHYQQDQSTPNSNLTTGPLTVMSIGSWEQGTLENHYFSTPVVVNDYSLVKGSATYQLSYSWPTAPSGQLTFIARIYLRRRLDVLANILNYTSVKATGVIKAFVNNAEYKDNIPATTIGGFVDTIDYTDRYIDVRLTRPNASTTTFLSSAYTFSLGSVRTGIKASLPLNSACPFDVSAYNSIICDSWVVRSSTKAVLTNVSSAISLTDIPFAITSTGAGYSYSMDDLLAQNGQILTSPDVADGQTISTTIKYKSALPTSFTSSSLYNGTDFTTSKVIYFGDVNSDLAINSTDIAKIGAYLGYTDEELDWTVKDVDGVSPYDCDLDNDGDVDSSDAAIATVNLGLTA